MMPIKKKKICSGHPTSCFCHNGFTLLEIMAAVSVIAIALVSIYQLHIRTISMNIDAKFYTIAPLLAQEKLVELELAPIKEVTDSAGDFGDAFPGFTYRILIENIETDLIGAVSENLKKINITIGFNADEFTYDLKTYRLFQE